MPLANADAADVPSHHWSPSKAQFARHSSDTIVKPFRIFGGGPASDGIPLVPGESGVHSATGVARGLGRYKGEGVFTLDSLEISETGAATGTFHGTFVFTASNGDKLAVTYGDGGSGKLTGQVSADGTKVVDVKFDAFFAPDPASSTGRFERVVGGGWRMIARAKSVSLQGETEGFTAPFNYRWHGKGKLEYAKPNIVKPFRINGGGPAPEGLPLDPSLPPGPHFATGFATGLGRYKGAGEFSLESLSISETGAVTGTFQGTFVFTASNGDKLAVTYGDGGTGVLTGQTTEDGRVVDVKFDAFFKPDPDNSTGRFERVVGGGWQMIAKTDSISLAGLEPGYTAPFDYTWTGRGKLEYSRR